MPSCTVITCKNRSAINTYIKHGVTYHIFPHDNPSLKEKWIDATGRGPNWFPLKRSVICSDHFQEDCFQPLPKSRRLFEWAYPTICLCKIVSSNAFPLDPPSSSKESPQEFNLSKLCVNETENDFAFDLCDQPLSYEENQTTQVKEENDPTLVSNDQIFSDGQNGTIQVKVENEFLVDHLSKDRLVFSEENQTIQIKEQAKRMFDHKSQLHLMSVLLSTYESSIGARSKCMVSGSILEESNFGVPSTSQLANLPKEDTQQLMSCSDDLREKSIVEGREAQLRAQLIKYENMMKLQRRKIKSLQKQTSRYKQRINKLEAILKKNGQVQAAS